MKLNTKSRVFALCFAAALISACSSSSNDEVLNSALTVGSAEPQYVQQPTSLQPTAIAPVAQIAPENPIVTAHALPSAQQIGAPQELVSTQYAQSNQQELFKPSSDGITSFAAPKPEVIEIKPRENKTYLINGLGSAVKAIGYGFVNLSKKIPNSELYNYASPLESSTIIRRKVTRQIKAAYRRNPNIEINLIGISFGANIVTLIAGELDRSNIPVNYLVTMDGPAMVPVRDNVRYVDNFTCSGLTCFRTKSRLARGNRTTKYASFKMPTGHIPLANYGRVHSRILGQLDMSRKQYAISVAAQQSAVPSFAE